MIANVQFIDSLRTATVETLMHLGELATTNKVNATNDEERDQFQMAELAIFLELNGRRRKIEKAERRAKIAYAAAAAASH